MLLFATMASKIKLFQSVEKYNRSMGVRPRQPNQKWTPNTINLIFLISFAQLAIGSTAFLIYREKSTFEFGACFYDCATQTSIFTLYLIQMWQITNILRLINHFEEFIEKSKLTRQPTCRQTTKNVFLFQFLCLG